MDLHTRDEFKRWVDRLVDAGLQLKMTKLLVSGPPWNTAFAMLFTDTAMDPDGSIAYSNSGAVTGRVAWGRIVEQRDNLDTQRVLAWDEHIAARAATA